jgi:hypothetical protein
MPSARQAGPYARPRTDKRPAARNGADSLGGCHQTLVRAVAVAMIAARPAPGTDVRRMQEQGPGRPGPQLLPSACRPWLGENVGKSAEPLSADVSPLPPDAWRDVGGARLTAAEVTAYVVAAAVWAPSVHNTQPWWFAADDGGIALYADCSRQLSVADPSGREMMISCGAALFTAKLALRSLGFAAETRVLPDRASPLLVARLRWRRRAEPAGFELRLFSHVTRRRTHRGGFEPLPLMPGLLGALRQGAERDGAALRVAADESAAAALAAAVDMAERVQRSDSRYVRELAAWAPPPGSRRLDGVSPSSYPARPDRTSPYFPGRDFARGHDWGLPASSPAASARFTGVVCLLTTPADTPADWVHAGHALQRILLTSASYGAAAALASQPVEIGWLREMIRNQVGDRSYPQLVLRLGTVIQNAISMRRPPGSVLIARTTATGLPLAGLDQEVGASSGACLGDSQSTTMNRSIAVAARYISGTQVRNQPLPPPKDPQARRSDADHGDVRPPRPY